MCIWKRTIDTQLGIVAALSSKPALSSRILGLIGEEEITRKHKYEIVAHGDFSSTSEEGSVNTESVAKDDTDLLWAGNGPSLLHS